MVAQAHNLKQNNKCKIYAKKHIEDSLLMTNEYNTFNCKIFISTKKSSNKYHPLLLIIKIIYLYINYYRNYISNNLFKYAGLD